MANGQGRSRSPVQPLATTPRYGADGAASRSWVDSPPSRQLHPPSLAHEPLACPECGSRLQLQLRALDAPPQVPRPTPLRPAPAAETRTDFEASVREHKRHLLRRALQENGGVMTRAAKAVGLKYTTFVAMAHRLGIVEDKACD
jgi:DNA-binding NtrC family response regulator